VCEGEVADDLVGRCALHSCTKESWQSRCQTKFCTGVVVVVAQLCLLLCWKKNSGGLSPGRATYGPRLCCRCLDSRELVQPVLVGGSWSGGRVEAPRSPACPQIWGEAKVGDQVWQAATSALYQLPVLDQGALSAAPNFHQCQLLPLSDLTISHLGCCLHQDQRSESCPGLE